MRSAATAWRQTNEPDLRAVGLHPNFWYPLALATDLKRSKMLAVSFAGEPIVLVRTASDTVFALEDRCAHRQVPLSRGVLSGEKLICGYHAWSYDQDGRCQVPYLPKDAAAPCGVRSFPCRVAYNLIFIFPGDPQLASRVALPDLPFFHSDNYVSTCFVRQVNCHYSFVHENLMDMNHQFLHRRWMGRLRPAVLASRKSDGCVEVDYRFDHLQRKFDLRNILQSLVGVRGTPHPVTAPPSDASVEQNRLDGDFMTVSTRYPYQELHLRRPNSAEPMLSLWVAYVSVDREQRINRPCGVLLIRKPAVRWLAYILRPLFSYFTDSIFEEDRIALEAEQRAHDLQGADWNQEVLPFIIDLRKLLAASGVPISSLATAG